jgi:hypothetical protein
MLQGAKTRLKCLNYYIYNIFFNNSCFQVSYQEASSFAERLGFIYIETSAKTGYNVRLLFTKLSKDLFVRDYMKHKEIREEAKQDDNVILDRRVRNNKVTPKCNC